MEFSTQALPTMVSLHGELRDGDRVVGEVSGSSGLVDPEQHLTVTLERERYAVTLRRP